MRPTLDTYCCLTVLLLLFGAACAEGARACRSAGHGAGAPDACRGCEEHPSVSTGPETFGAADSSTCCRADRLAAQPVDSVLPDGSSPQHAARFPEAAALFPPPAAGEVLPVQVTSFASAVPLHILHAVFLT